MMRVKSRKKFIGIFVIMMMALLLLSSCQNASAEYKEFKTLEDLKNCKFALSDGNSSYEQEIKHDITDVILERYTNYFDTFIAVANDNADAAFAFKYTFIGIKEGYPNLKYIEGSLDIPIVANFSNKADAIRMDFNSFIAESKQNGLLDKLTEKWLYEYDELTDEDIVDFSILSDNSKKIRFALCDNNIPYDYLKNGKLTGYEPALFCEFCEAYDYKPEITQSTFDAVVAGLAAGKYDMAMSAYGYTDERNENSNFSDPYFVDKVVYVVNGIPDTNSFLSSIDKSFERTFVKQDRWKMFINGMLVTLLITVLSIVIGSIVGFMLFIISQRNKWLEKLSYVINNTLEALPILVVLMIFFYVIFGKSNISGVTVSIIVFGLSFAFTFFALVSNSVKGISVDQTEAGLALGYSDRQTLFKIVLPQAMESFIPSIKSAIVTTLKGTAIVGYVAVQDLTKAGDLIRSQTFEAFLPIITVALLYFILAKILIYLLNKFFVTPKEKRNKEKKEGK